MENCNTNITIIQTEEPCAGNYTLSSCVTIPNNITYLDLAANSNQTQVNAALVTALNYKDEQIQAIENSIILVDGSETIVTSGDNVTITGIGSTTSPYVVNTKSGGFIEVTKSQLDTLISESSLKIGSTYKITGVHLSLYDDGTNQGTTIFLQALTEDKLSLEGSGLFYNPKYNQGIDEFGIWSNRSTWTATLVSGAFEAQESITANNGATGTLFTSLDANIFISTGGDWTTATSIVGNSTSATATITNVVVQFYAIGDKVIWGGYSWTNLMGFVGSNVDSLIMDFEWEKDSYDLTNYSLTLDLIQYDYENDLIIYRSDTAGNIVSTSKSDYDYWYDDGFIGNPINVFQWGNALDYFNYLGIGKNVIENSYCENINFSGSEFYNNRLSDNSYFSNNTLSNKSDFTYNILINRSSFYNNKLSTNSYFSSNILNDRCGLDNNILSKYSRLQNNTLSGNSRLQNNTLSDNSFFYNNKLSTNSYFYSNILSKYSRLQNNTLSTYSSFTNNILNNSSGFNLNILNNYSSFQIIISFELNLKNVEHITAENSTLSGDISTATLIFENYPKTMYKRPDGVSKLRYYNNSDVLVIANVTD